jgi:hypothetical protein
MYVWRIWEQIFLITEKKITAESDKLWRLFLHNYSIQRLTVLIAQQAVKIKELSIATYTPPVIKNGVLVQCARVTIPTVKRGTVGINWYEYKYILKL